MNKGKSMLIVSKKSYFLAIICMFGLCSCGIPWTGYKEYKPKEGEPTASITFNSNIAGTTSISMLNEARCDSSGFGYEALSLSSLFGLEKQIDVRADKRLHIRLTGTNVQSVTNNQVVQNEVVYNACKVRISFIPKKGNHYLVRYRATQDGCYAKVYQYVQTGESVSEIEEPTVRPECEGRY